MTATMSDTHAWVKELTEAGMPEQQAEALTRPQTASIDEKPATKDDLKKLELATKRDLKEPEQSTKTSLKDMELRPTLCLGSMMVVSVGAFAAPVKLL